jgi:glucuronoarabinoxylan endo-1,4-beta-xylanase
MSVLNKVLHGTRRTARINFAAAQKIARTSLPLAISISLGLILTANPAFARKAVTATVNTTKVHQEIAGFGGAEAYFQGYLAHHPHKLDIYDALFGPVNGLHIDFLRLQDTFRYQNKPDFDADTVDIVQYANSLRGNPITVVMSSWTPPASLKSNKDEKNGGTLIKKNGHYDYEGFAQYWKDSVLAYRAVGINPTYISIQNEPDITTDYESCRFNPTEAPYHGDSFAGYDKAVDAVYAAFQTLPSPPHLLGPETIGIGDGNVQAFTKAQNADHIYAVTHHLYTGGDKNQPDTYIPAMQAVKDQNPGRLKFQTEYYTGGGFETAEMIHNSLVTEEVNMYLYWPLSWPGVDGTMLTIENPADPSKWKTPHGWSYTDGYYAVKHYSYFIHAGYHRVDASTSNDEVKISAYLSPKGDKLAVVLINASATAANSVKLKLGDFDHGQSSVYRTTFPNTPERFASLGTLGADNSISLPPHSIVTVEITH